MKRVAVQAVTLGALVAGAIAVSAAPASAAAGPGQLQVCSAGNYASYVEFPARGGWATYVVPRNTCDIFTIGHSTAVEPITVRGLYNTSSSTFVVAKGQVRPSRGGNVTTYGTTKAGNHWAQIPSV